MVAATIFVILGVCGMAIDLGFMYNRRVELQNLADATALAAAIELDGTPAGVAKARSSAASVAAAFRYAYTRPVTWKDDALRFGSSPARTGGWIPGSTANSTPGGLLFARVDTADLDATLGTVSTVFMNVLGAGRDSVLQGYAIAGRTGVKVAPLAICALSNQAIAPRTTGAGAADELVELGFRRGISYDLMNLNPGGLTAENFVINPFAPPGTTGTAGPTSLAIVGPYICRGTMSIPRVLGGALTVARKFPLSSLVDQLNSRFELDLGNTCNRVMAPPDANIKQYVYSSISWMSTTPLAQSAAMVDSAGGKLITIADASPSPVGSSAGMFGPLWSFARAVPYSAVVPGQPEPAAGYAPFPTSDWAKLYDPGKPSAGTYPGTVPYLGTDSAVYKAASTTVRAQYNRRVLNVALLKCPVGAGTTVAATALGIGKFFMTVPATTKTLHAEFAGLVSDEALGTSTGLFP
jgi:Flp pilus assembly protein TadG